MKGISMSLEWVQSARASIFARMHGVEVSWSAEDMEWVATSPNYPSLSWLSPTYSGAVSGLLVLIARLDAGDL